MAEAASNGPETSGEASSAPIIHAGILTKQGGIYRNWNKRYFVLQGTTLKYYKKEGDPEPKGVIDLTKGRGVRPKAHTKEVKWPEQATKQLTFAVAVEGRTYYIHGTKRDDVQKWKTEIEKVMVEKSSTITDDWRNDTEGQPEPILSKVVTQVAKIGTQVAKLVAKEAGVDDDLVEGAADVVENQVEAGRDASVKDRVKMAVGDAADVVGDNVDNDVVGVACDVVKDQAEGDDDLTIGQRVGMAAGTGLQSTSGLVDNEIGAGVMNTAGGIVHDQAEADTDATISERIAIGVGSAAAGVGDSVNDDTVQGVAKIVEKGAEKIKDDLEEERKKDDEDEDSDGDD